jgi:ubiquinol-cytochrome c reductase cytochrome c subunit
MKISCRNGFTALVVVAAAWSVSAPHLRAQTTVRPSTADQAAGNAATGKRLYTKYGCYECHGYEGQGSSLTGPRLGPNPMPIATFVRYARRPTGEMPPYTDKVVSDQDLADIHAFLKALRPLAAAATIPLLK